MIRTVMAAALLAALATDLPAAPVPVPPVEDELSGPPPTLVVVKRDGKGQLHYTRTSTRMVRETRAVAVKEGGRVVTKTQIALVPVFEQRELTLDLDKVQATDVGGRRVSAAEIRDRLRRPTAVVIAPEHFPKIAQVYLRALRADTLILTLPAEKVPVAPPPTTQPVPSVP